METAISNAATAPAPAAKPVTAISPAATTAARLSLGSTILFLVSFAAVHLLKPEIDPTWRFISEYSIGDYGWVMVLAFLALAVSYLSLVPALWSQVWVGGKIGLGFLVIGAAGLILAAIFTTQAINTNPADLTMNSQLHGLGTILGTNGAGLGSLIVTLNLAFNKVWRPARWALIAAVAFTAIANFWFIMSMPADGIFGPHVAIGLPNRLLVLSYCVWLLITAWYATRLRTVTSNN
jgi:Protein of unknown function (DUF998)